MERQSCLRLGAFLPRSRANGPGVRAALWVQGCLRRCPGCCNPEFQDPEEGESVTVADVLTWVQNAMPVDGVTLTGGEPLDQAAALAVLCGEVRSRGLTVVCFTGYTLAEAEAAGREEYRVLLRRVDLLVAGPYLREQRSSAPLLASANQKLHFLSGRIVPADLEGLPRAEVIMEGGELRVSGFDPQLSERLRHALEGGRSDNA